MSQPGEISQTRHAGVFLTQADRGVIPDLREVQKISKEIAGVVNWSSRKGLYAKGQNLRDAADEWFNGKFFQPLALATGGWAMRVSSSEMLLNTLRQGPLNFSAARIATSLMKHDLALGIIHTDPAVLKDLDTVDRLEAKGIKVSTAHGVLRRSGVNTTRAAISAIRGVLAGTDMAMLTALGVDRDRYLHAATRRTCSGATAASPRGCRPSTTSWWAWAWMSRPARNRPSCPGEPLRLLPQDQERAGW